MKLLFFIVSVLISIMARAIIPVEVFNGHEKSTIDIMFFNYFERDAGRNSHWLFFNRNRAGIDYRMTAETYKPQFGFTEAVSYNHPRMKGFAPVVLVQIYNGGIYPKAGLQYSKITKYCTIFSWMVCETLTEPDLDIFLLFRYTPDLTKKIKAFIQFEVLNSFLTADWEKYNFTQRVRLGLKIRNWQTGIGADFNEAKSAVTSKGTNIGTFIRHEF